MKRLLALLLALAFCLLSLCACAGGGEEDVPSGMLRARSAELDLWLFYPEAWLVAENNQVLKLISAEQNSLENQTSAVTDGGAVLPSNVANVTVCRMAEGVSDLEEYATGEFRLGFSEKFVFQETADLRKHGKDDGYTIRYHLAGSEQGKILYQFTTTLILHDGQVYAMTFTAVPELYELMETTVSDMRRSITFEKVSEEANTPLTAPPSETVPESADKIVQKEGLSALTNAGVNFILYYPSERWSVTMDSGFLAIRTESGASVSVVRGDAFSAQVQSPKDYVDQYYYPSFDALYGSHEELSRKETQREDAHLTEVTYQAEIEGESYTFVQALYFRGGYLYTLLYTAKTAEFDTYLGDVNTMIAEFTLK